MKRHSLLGKIVITSAFLVFLVSCKNSKQIESVASKKQFLKELHELGFSIVYGKISLESKKDEGEDDIQKLLDLFGEKNDDDSEQDKDTIWRKAYERPKEIPSK